MLLDRAQQVRPARLIQVAAALREVPGAAVAWNWKWEVRECLECLGVSSITSDSFIPGRPLASRSISMQTKASPVTGHALESGGLSNPGSLVSLRKNHQTGILRNNCK